MHPVTFGWLIYRRPPQFKADDVPKVKVFRWAKRRSLDGFIGDVNTPYYSSRAVSHLNNQAILHRPCEHPTHATRASLAKPLYFMSRRTHMLLLKEGVFRRVGTTGTEEERFLS